MSEPPPRVPDRAGPEAAGTATQDPIRPGVRFVGRYQLQVLLARGGMAEVWEGHDDVLSRSVALKVLPMHLAADSSFVERFHREAVVAARLGHPSVVATYDTGVDRGTAFIVMELVRGQTLRDLLSRTGALDPGLAVGIATQIADALAHAHRAGLVHRDIKPANVLLCDDDGGPPRVKVADFGIAKSTLPGQDLTRTGSVLGTPKYLSPEQVRGETEPDARSDLYALGVVLFEMLTGRPPLVGPTEMATALAHLHDEAPPPSSLRGGIPPELDAMVGGLLAKSPGERPPTAVAARQRLEVIARELAAARNARPAPRPAPSGPTRIGPAGGDRRPPALSGPVGTGGWIDGALGPRAAPAPAAGPRLGPSRAQDPTSANATSALRRAERPPAPYDDLRSPPPGPGRTATAGGQSRPPADTGSRRARRRRRGPGVLVALLVVAAGAVGVVLVKTSLLAPAASSSQRRVAAGGGVVEPTAATVWMDNSRSPDNPTEAHLAIDGRTATAWTTLQYHDIDRATFGGLYDGIGLAVELPARRTLSSLTVTSATQDWSASTYVAASRIPSGGSLAEWGRPTATKRAIHGDATFSLAGRQGRWVLLWLTNIGPTGQASVAEITIR